MKKMADMMSKAGKWLLVFGIVFSQLSFPLEVLANELDSNVSNDVETPVEEDKNEEETPENGSEETTDDNTTEEETPENSSDETTDDNTTEEETPENSSEETTDDNTTEEETPENDSDETTDDNTTEEETPENSSDETTDDKKFDIDYQKTILDDIIFESELSETNDINGDGKLNILDATDEVFMDTDNGEVVEDVLTNTLVLENEEILIGETVLVKLYLKGFSIAKLYGIEGILNFDDTVLELVGSDVYESTTEENTSTDVTDENISTDVTEESADSEEIVEVLGDRNVENNKFAYVFLNGFDNEEEAILTFEFEALTEGVTEISISDLIESYGEVFEIKNETVVNLTVSNPEDNKGGDVEEDNTPEEDDTTQDDTTTDSSDEVVGGTTTDVTDNTVIEVRPVVKSSDYYISNLKIEGYEIDFNMYNYEYSINVGADVTSLNFDVLLHDARSIYYVEGNENFKEGENLVHLVVRAENGSTKTYTIKVVKEEKEEEKNIEKDKDTKIEEEKEDETSTSKTVIIILIILVIIGLIYVIFKDDEDDKKDSKKDNKKEVKAEPKKSESVRIEKVETKPAKSTTKSTKNNNSTKKNTKKGNKK